MGLPRRSRRRQPLQSADEIAGNDDLLTEILTRLPSKSLGRFKSVSKHWYSLISDPHFSLLRIPKSPSGIFVDISVRRYQHSYKYIHLSGNRPKKIPFKYLNFVEDHNRIKILHSCNGLLLCSSSNFTRNPKYYIYNPTTKQFAIIPPPFDVAANQYFISIMNLAFDPFRAPHFKIVVVLCTQPPYARKHSCYFQIKIYSSETGTWRGSGDPFIVTNLWSFSDGVFFNSTVHWLTNQFQVAFRFDIDKESLETMPMPMPIIESDSKEINLGYFGESHGHLHLVCGYKYSNPFEVFEMERDYSKWFVKYRVHLSSSFPGILLGTQFSILHVLREENEEESYLVMHISGMVVSYNFRDETVKKLCKLKRYKIAYEDYSDAHLYTETLCRVN